MPRIHLKDGRIKPILNRHPWVFADSVETIEGEPEPGQEVDVVGPDEQFLGRGWWNPESAIPVRIFSWRPEQAFDAELIKKRLEAALALRTDLLQLPEVTNAWRLVNGEGDRLPGLVVDCFAEVLVIQLTILGLKQARSLIVEALEELLEPAAIVERDPPQVAELEGFKPTNKVISGELPEGDILIEEHGLLFGVDVLRGQKTGFYLDQRDNRLRVASLAEGRRVLDGFSYTGGFALSAAAGGAEQVIAVESAKGANLALERNLELNPDLTVGVQAQRGDVFKYLSEAASAKERFGMIICDPPKYVTKASEMKGGLKKLEELAGLAVDALEPGGLLVFCDCSGRVDERNLWYLLQRVSVDKRRTFRLLESCSQAPDHAVELGCPESRYLKALFVHVE